MLVASGVSGYLPSPRLYGSRFMRRTEVLRNTAKSVADTSSSNIPVRVLDDKSHRVCASVSEAVSLGNRERKHADRYA